MLCPYPQVWMRVFPPWTAVERITPVVLLVIPYEHLRE